MVAIKTPIANRLGLNRGWINPLSPAILLNTKDTSTLALMAAESMYLRSYLLIQEYLRFQQINLITFDIKTAPLSIKILYLTIYQHMRYDYKEDLYTELKFLWFNKQALQQRYKYKSKNIYNFNVLKNIKKAIKIKKVLKRHRIKVRNKVLCDGKEWQHMQIRYLRRKTKTWYRRRREIKFTSNKKSIKNQLKNKLKVNIWKYFFVRKPIILKNEKKKLKRLRLKRLKLKTSRCRTRYTIKKSYKLKFFFIKRSIKKFWTLKKYRKKVSSTINKKSKRFLTDIQTYVNNKSKNFVIRHFEPFEDKIQTESWIFQNENKIQQNNTLRNVFNIKYLKFHLKIFLELFFKNSLGVDCIIKINQTSKKVYVKKAIKGLSTVNLELTRINKLDYFKRLAYVFINAHKNQEPQIIADLIAREVELTREFKHFCYNIDLVFSAFMSGFLHSYRIVISGKTNPKDLRRNWEVIKYQNKDSIPKKQFNKRVLYALGVARNNRGVFGIKVWLYY